VPPASEALLAMRCTTSAERLVQSQPGALLYVLGSWARGLAVPLIEHAALQSSLPFSFTAEFFPKPTRVILIQIQFQLQLRPVEILNHFDRVVDPLSERVASFCAEQDFTVPTRLLFGHGLQRRV
jgi:hypothetical protein